MADDEEISEEEMVALFAHIQQKKQSGMSRQDIRAEFIDGGMEEAAAKELVNTALRPDMAVSSGGGGGGFPGWLIWIGLILLVNFLSYVFDWSFWIY